MAEIPFPSAPRTAWLDRPVFPARARIWAVTAHWQLIAYSALIVAGFGLRIWNVGVRAMHHDESLHAYYAWKLFDGQGYTYDPLMHGPFKFVIVPLFYLIFGDSEFAARLPAVLFGTILIALPLFFRRYITPLGAFLASMMIAVSPGLVYFSRFIRDDIFLATFTFALAIALVRYLEDHRPIYLYAAAAAIGLAMTTMEASYITMFIFGSFLVFEGIREKVTSGDGPVLSALRATSLDSWLTGACIFVVIVVLMFSSFFSNPYGIWDPSHPLCSANCLSLHPTWSSDRKDILGGIAYWLAQHSVQRGGQPWFYYLLVLPLYEQLAVLFGIAGIIFAAIRRSLITTFLVWWAVLSLLMYSWAGEKMPWLSIHMALPLILLGGLFLGSLWRSQRRWAIATAGAVFAILLAVEIHSTFLLNFIDGANPTEMLIYVQTSQDVPNVVSEIGQISAKHKLGSAITIGLDDSDVGGWPFTWYLRHYTNVTETSTFAGPTCGGQNCAVLVMLEPEFTQNSSTLMQHYVVQKYRWNWWFPEDYKTWFPQHWGDALHGNGPLVDNLIGTSSDRSNLWNWVFYRTPFGDRGARWLYFLVRRDLVPGGKSYSVSIPGSLNPVTPTGPIVSSRIVATMGASSSGALALAGPRGVAVSRSGEVYVADTLNHRISMYAKDGKYIGSWGTIGSGPGQFSSNNSPQSLAVGPDGRVYVADTWNHRIQVFSASGHYLLQWGSGSISTAPGGFYGPRSVAVSPSGIVYVADTGNKRIEAFTTRGKFLFSFGTAGTGTGQFMEPSSVAIGRDGTVYVADYWNSRIQAFTGKGSPLRSWKVPDWVSGSYDEPYLAVDSVTGSVLATDPQQRQILDYSPSGRLVGSIGSGRLSLPIGVAVRADGGIVVSDATANTVSIFRIGRVRAIGRAGTHVPTEGLLQSSKRR